MQVAAIGATPETYHLAAEIYAGVKARDTQAETALYEMVCSCRRTIATCSSDIDLDDRVHDTYIEVLTSLRKYKLNYPERLYGFVRRVAIRIAQKQIPELARRRANLSPMPVRDLVSPDAVHGSKGDSSLQEFADSHPTPEDVLLQKQHAAIVSKALGKLSDSDREILTRSFVADQDDETIRTDLGLSQKQLYNKKFRAKESFSAAASRLLKYPALAAAA